MSTEMTKLQNLLWWIASIAVSVVCCAALFVVFASHIVDVQTALNDNSMRINAIEQREDRILADLDIIRKHTLAQNPADITVSPASEKTPEATTTPTTVTPAAPVQVPVLPTAPEQK